MLAYTVAVPVFVKFTTGSPLLQPSATDTEYVGGTGRRLADPERAAVEDVRFTEVEEHDIPWGGG